MSVVPSDSDSIVFVINLPLTVKLSSMAREPVMFAPEFMVTVLLNSDSPVTVKSLAILTSARFDVPLWALKVPFVVNVSVAMRLVKVSVELKSKFVAVSVPETVRPLLISRDPSRKLSSPCRESVAVPESFVWKSI